jgi:hypothetical protein
MKKGPDVVRLGRFFGSLSQNVPESGKALSAFDLGGAEAAGSIALAGAVYRAKARTVLYGGATIQYSRAPAFI